MVVKQIRLPVICEEESIKPNLKESDIQSNGKSAPLAIRQSADDNRRDSCWRSNGAFTLIELLLVIAIIATLAALLLPAVTRAKSLAVNAICVNHLRQLSLATQMYWNDYGGRMHTESGIWPTWGSAGWQQSWAGQLLPYVAPGYRSGTPPVSMRKVFLDPGRPMTGMWLASKGNVQHYYLNSLPAYVAAGSPGTGHYTIDIKPIRYPSCFILFSDDLTGYATTEIDLTNETEDQSFGAPCLPPYHNGYANFAFADGHVAPYKRWQRGQMTCWYNKMAKWDGSP